MSSAERMRERAVRKGCADVLAAYSDERLEGAFVEGYWCAAVGRFGFGSFEGRCQHAAEPG